MACFVILTGECAKISETFIPVSVLFCNKKLQRNEFQGIDHFLILLINEPVSNNSKVCKHRPSIT